jgi:hypothetical protein
MVPRKQPRDIEIVPGLRLRAHVEESFRHIRYADSVTIDPHKSGYVPYPGQELRVLAMVWCINVL